MQGRKVVPPVPSHVSWWPQAPLTCLISVYISTINPPSGQNGSYIRSGWWYTYPSEKYESQLGWLSHIFWKIINVWNHQPEMVAYLILFSLNYTCSFMSVYAFIFPGNPLVKSQVFMLNSQTLMRYHGNIMEHVEGFHISIMLPSYHVPVLVYTSVFPGKSLVKSQIFMVKTGSTPILCGSISISRGSIPMLLS